MKREYDLEDILAEYSEPFSDPALQDETAPEAPEVGGESLLTPKEAWDAEEDEADEELSADAKDSKETFPAKAGLTQVFHAPAAEKKTAETEAAPKKKAGKKKKKKRESLAAKLGFGLLSLIFAVISLGVLAWSLLNLHPDTAAVSADTARTAGSTNLVSRLDDGLNNSKANALRDITSQALQHSGGGYGCPEAAGSLLRQRQPGERGTGDGRDRGGEKFGPAGRAGDDLFPESELPAGYGHPVLL